MKRFVQAAFTGILATMGGLVVAAALPSSPPPSFFPKAPPVPVRSDMDYEAHAARLRKSLPADAGLTVLVEEPFVIATDVPADQIEAIRKTTRWAVDHLKRDYFERDPDRIVDVFVFKDEQSYTKKCKDVLHQAPDAAFPLEGGTTLAVNWDTGNGTLVRELVHPFMAANFARCPPWLDAGLATLFEEGTADKQDHIIGKTNWRLHLLQETLEGNGPREEGPAPSFKDLCAMDAARFYGKGRMPDTNVARYLLYYLQEKGVLRQFYADVRQNQKNDPTGYATLAKTLAGLGENDMGVFRRRWEVWLMGLTYP